MERENWWFWDTQSDGSGLVWWEGLVEGLFQSLFRLMASKILHPFGWRVECGWIFTFLSPKALKEERGERIWLRKSDTTCKFEERDTHARAPSWWGFIDRWRLFLGAPHFHTERSIPKTREDSFFFSYLRVQYILMWERCNMPFSHYWRRYWTSIRL